MESQRNIAGGMGQVKTRDDACIVCSFRNSFYIKCLAGVIVDSTKQYEGKFIFIFVNCIQNIFSEYQMFPLPRFYFNDDLVGI